MRCAWYICYTSSKYKKQIISMQETKVSFLPFVISLPRRGCVIVHDPDCVLSHDRRTRLLRMNIVNILLNLRSADKPSSDFSLVFRFPWLSVNDRISHAVTRPPTTSRHPQETQQIQARNKPTREKNGQIRARNLQRKFPTNLDMAWRILTHTGAS